MFFTIVANIFNFVGALTILLFGMNLLSAGIQKGAGDQLQRILRMISGSRVTAVLTGLVVTSIIQSSGATTVMVVSFVNAEILSLTQAIGIIFGANIGTTVTAWIVSFFGFKFSIEAISIPLFGIGFVIQKLKKFKIHNFGEVFMGFGLLFFGLGLLSKSLNLNPESVAFLQNLSNYGVFGILIGVLAGIVITALIHSSSAMTAIVLTMAFNGSIGWELSAAIIFGSNIGSTVDAVLSALDSSVNAKRAALVHVGFNTIGTLVALILFKPFLSIIDFIVPLSPVENITTHIAMLHTIFNVMATLIFLPFVNQIANLVTKIIKDKEIIEESHYKLPVIEPNVKVGSEIYEIQMEKEIFRMAGRVMTMFDDIYNALLNRSEEIALQSENILSEKKIYIQEMHESITSFIVKCLKLPSSTSASRERFSKLMQIADGLNNLAEENESTMYKILKYLGKRNAETESESYDKIINYLEKVRTFFEVVSQRLLMGLTDGERTSFIEIENDIDSIKKALKKISRKRIEEGADVKVELNYMDIVRRIEKAGDCVYGLVKII